MTLTFDSTVISVISKACFVNYIPNAIVAPNMNTIRHFNMNCYVAFHCGYWGHIPVHLCLFWLARSVPVITKRKRDGKMYRMYNRKKNIRIFVRNKARYNPETKEKDFLFVDINDFAGTTIGDIKEV